MVQYSVEGRQRQLGNHGGPNNRYARPPLACSSPRPQRGPEPRKRMSLATFIRLTATWGGESGGRGGEGVDLMGHRRLTDVSVLSTHLHQCTARRPCLN